MSAGSLQEPHSQPTAWKWAKEMKDGQGDAGPSPAGGNGGGEGLDPGEQLLLELIALGGARAARTGVPLPRKHAITGPLSREKEASVFILCTKKQLFYYR